MPIIMLILFLLLVSCLPQEKNPVAGSGMWEITNVAGQPVLEYSSEFKHKPRPYITLDQIGNGPITVGGYSGCNNYGGVIDYTQSGDQQNIVSDMMHCGEDIAVQEMNIFYILSNNPEFSFDYNTKTMWAKTKDGRSFTGKQIVDNRKNIIGQWKVVSLNGVEFVEGEDNPYIYVYIQDTTIKAQSQCIPFSWTYETQGPKISLSYASLINENGQLMVTCARGLSDHENKFSDAMDEATEYTVNDLGQVVITSPKGNIILAPK